MSLSFGAGKRRIGELEQENKELARKLERAEVRVEEQKKKVEKLDLRLKDTDKAMADVRQRSREYRDECRKSNRQLEELMMGKDERMKKLDSQTELLAHVEKELKRYKELLTQSEDRIASLSAPPPAPEEKAPVEKTDEREMEGLEDKLKESAAQKRGLKTQIEELKGRLKSRDIKIRQLQRKSENSHRAYVITSLQLDLAHDEVYLLKTGKIRRDTEKARAQMPVAAKNTSETPESESQFEETVVNGHEVPPADSVIEPEEE